MLASSKGAIIKVRRKDKRKRSIISTNNYRPTFLKEDVVKAESKDKESIILVIVKKKKVKAVPYTGLI